MRLQNRKTRLLLLGVLLATIVGLLTCYPLWEPRLPHGTDTLVHLYGLVSLDTLMQQGILYSRWMPYKASGFGSPFSHYYAPLPFYAAQVFCELGADAVTALRLALGLALAGAAVGMYRWARDAFGVPAGLVAATAYVCAPYLLYNVYFRGGIGEHYALMLMPWTLSALHRLRHTGRTQDLFLSAFGYAGVILAHNLTALIFTPMLGGYVLVLALNGVSPQTLFHQSLTGQLASAWRRLPWFRLATAIGLGLALSAFFWLPLATERDAIHQTMLYAGDEFDYRTHFLGPDALLTDTAPGLALYPITVGLAAFGLLMTLWRDPARRLETGYIALVAAGCTLMTLPAAAVVWDALPLLRYFQFPHRFLGMATLCLAFLVGGAAHVLSPTCLTHRYPGTVTVASGVALAAVLLLLLRPINALSQVRYYSELPDLDVNFVMRKDREAGNIFSAYTVNFIPTTVQEPPPFALLAHDGPERLDTDTLPSTTTVLTAKYTPLRYTLTFSAAQPFTATFNTFYFPGWRAHLDGSSAPIVPAVPHGRISVALPAGQHNLAVWFGTTPLRTCANGISLLALVGVTMTLVWRGKRRWNKINREA
jgi:hypothetical protein